MHVSCAVQYISVRGFGLHPAQPLSECSSGEPRKARNTHTHSHTGTHDMDPVIDRAGRKHKGTLCLFGGGRKDQIFSLGYGACTVCICFVTVTMYGTLAYRDAVEANSLHLRMFMKQKVWEALASQRGQVKGKKSPNVRERRVDVQKTAEDIPNSCMYIHT
jgi:hypothetical protein